MHVKKTTNSPTSVSLTISLSQTDLNPLKERAVQRLGANVKLPGFRSGKAPQALVQKNLDPSQLQTEVVEEAINHYFSQAVRAERLRPVGQPEIEIKKFVPYTELEFSAKAEVIGQVKLPDYKKMTKPQVAVSITAADVNEVLDQLRERSSERKPVKRAAKLKDEATINFKGFDAKGIAFPGGEGKDYPLVLGSKSFIPGFEEQLVGLKEGDKKTFAITFPKDYGASNLAGQKTSFEVEIIKIQELVPAKLDDDFAKKVGPFKDLKDLKDDIKAQLTKERQGEADRKYENELVNAIAAKTSVDIPESLIEGQLDAAEREERQNLTYRGQTWEEHLKEEGVTAEEHRKRNRAKAEAQVKAGLVLSEIAEAEGLDVTAEELDNQVKLLKAQYQDAAMQAELDKPENRRDLASRILTEKTIARLRQFSVK